MASYYPQLNVVVIDDQGFAHSLVNESINVYNVTNSSVDADLLTDAEGIIAEGSMSGAAGDVIELSHDTYPLTMRLTLQVDQETAYTAVENDITTFVVENLFVDTTDATTADIYIQDLAQGDEPKLLGAVKAGETGFFPFQTSLPKTMRVYAVSKSDSFLKTEDAFSGGTDVVISATVGQFISIFDLYTDITTTGTVAEDLSIDAIPANTFLLDGDEVRITYRGYYALGGNSKQIVLSLEASDFYDAGSVTKSGGGFTIETQMIRSDEDTVRITAAYHDTDNHFVQYIEITGLNFAADLDVTFAAITSGAAGDLTLASAKAFFIPASPVSAETFYLTNETGDILTNETGDRLIQE